MNRKSWLKLCISLGIAAAVGCSTDKGVGTSIDDGEDPSETDGRDGDDEGNETPRGGIKPMDAAVPDEPEVIDVAPADASCAATSAVAEKITEKITVPVTTMTTTVKPVAIYLMLDRSSSMVGVCAPPQMGRPAACNAQSWTQATGAISAFLRDPANADLKVALGYFPPKVTYTDKTPTSPLCTGASCGAATVSMRRAADNAAAITDSLNTSVPPNSTVGALYTPTECGLRGIKAFCAAHRAANNNEKCVGVLITDGAPTECNVGTPALQEIAAANAADIPVFALGMTGADFGFLNAIATSGGTKCTANAAACDVSGGQAAFLAALNGIRETVVETMTNTMTVEEIKEVPLACEWNLPDPPEDMKFDKEKVNVIFSGTNMDARPLVRAKSEADCAKGSDGWRYDSEDEPKKVLACPQTCEQIKAAPGAKVGIEFGCKGRTLE